MHTHASSIPTTLMDFTLSIKKAFKLLSTSNIYVLLIDYGEHKKIRDLAVRHIKFKYDFSLCTCVILNCWLCLTWSVCQCDDD